MDNTNRIISNIARELTVALRLIGIEAASETKARTPIDTGNLSRSIQAVVGSDELIQTAGASHIGTADPGEVVIGTNVHYAEQVENREPKSSLIGRARGPQYMARGAQAMRGRGTQILTDRLARVQS